MDLARIQADICFEVALTPEHAVEKYIARLKAGNTC